MVPLEIPSEIELIVFLASFLSKIASFCSGGAPREMNERGRRAKHVPPEAPNQTHYCQTAHLPLTIMSAGHRVGTSDSGVPWRTGFAAPCTVVTPLRPLPEN